MSTAYLLGFFWIFVAGVTQGAFPLPMKYTRTWKWEHLWFWYSVISFFVLPLALAVATVPRLASVYSLTPRDPLILTALFGMGWGAGSVFFGLGLDALGMAVSQRGAGSAGVIAHSDHGSQYTRVVYGGLRETIGDQPLDGRSAIPGTTPSMS